MAPRVLPLIVGVLMAPVCAWALIGQQAIAWIVCPQALLVLFLRQAGRPFDSLGAAGLLELAIGVLCFPLVGWMIFEAIGRGKARLMAVRLGVFHGMAILAALAACTWRNWLWAL